MTIYGIAYNNYQTIANYKHIPGNLKKLVTTPEGHAQIFLNFAYGGVATAYRIPDNVYHFTTAEGGAGINKSGIIRASNFGIGGRGTYFTSSTSRTIATIQGAQGTAAMVRVPTAGLPLSRTLVPGSFVLKNASLLLTR
jgi:hypothetical protein